ncbi:MAG: OFA family MFS transporter [bacterium]
MSMSSEDSLKKGWIVTFAGTGVNLALGILYTWSIFRSEIQRSIIAGEGFEIGGFDWSLSAVNDPYAVCCLVFAFFMIPAGKFQDKLGPRLTTAIGGVLVGLGFLLISQSTEYWIWILGFGVMVGAGIGCGYSSATPAAIKWFPPAKTGLVAGLVVSGFGLAPAYISPLSTYLIESYGLIKTMQIFGVAFFFAVVLLSLLLINPAAGYSPPVPFEKVPKEPKIKPMDEATAGEMLKSGNFYLIWFAYFIGAGAGLMVISSINSMAQASLAELAFMAVMILAVGNATGRIAAGVISDYIGRENTLMIMLGFQALLMFIAMTVVDVPGTSAVIIILLATLIGFNYGTNLSIFPAITKDLWGLKNFGINYGLIFSAWGVGGFVFSRVYQMIESATQGQTSAAFLAAGIFLLVGVGLAFVIKKQLILLRRQQQSAGTGA